MEYEDDNSIFNKSLFKKSDQHYFRTWNQQNIFEKNKQQKEKNKQQKKENKKISDENKKLKEELIKIRELMNKKNK